MSTKEELILQRFGKNAASLRADKQLSLRELSAQCKLAHSTIALIEKGKVNVTLLTLLELAKGLDVSPTELLDF